MDDVEKKLQELMSSIFGVSRDEIDYETNQDSIEAWDSLMHFNLIVAIEEEWEITFPIEEIGYLTTFKLIALSLKEQIVT